jgi:HAD-hyrolase-like protein
MPGYSNPTSQQSRVSNHVLWPRSTSTSNPAQPGTPPSHRDEPLGGPPPYRYPSLQSASSALITMLMRCAAPASSKAMDTSSGSKRCRLVSVRRQGEVKPEPDLFLLCQQNLKVKRADCLVVGDAIWDIHAARRSGIQSVGLLSGGFGEQELYNADAMRVYRDAKALHQAIHELGFE